MKIFLIFFTFWLGIYGITAQSSLVIGGQAIVSVQDETGLRVRSEAGLSGEAVTSLFTGELVDMLDGSEDADGYTWWKIRTALGKEGWSVESADGIQTLIPITLKSSTGEADLTITVTQDVYNLVWSPQNFMLAVGFANGQVAFHAPELHFYSIEETGHPNFYMPTLVGNTLPEQIRYSTEHYPFAEISGHSDPNNRDSAINTVIYDYMIYEVGGIANDSPVPDEALPDDIEWVEPATSISVSACVPIETATIQQAQGTLQAGNPASFTSAAGESIQLGDGSGGMAWSTDSNRVVLWSTVTPSGSEESILISQGTAEVWDIESGTMIARVPHANPYTGNCGLEARPAALSPDGLRLGTLVHSSSTKYLMFWTLTET